MGAVFLMVAIGGYTRLSGAGLSIVEWRPVVGTFPPMSQAAWQEEFEKYKTSPEFKQVNFDMSYQAFQRIYFIEYFHRLVGRLVGLLFFVPLLVFWLRGQLSKGQKHLFLGASFLGCLQGFMGWYMVKSGLVKDPQVSPIRLTGHLLLAVAIMGLFYWEILRVLAPHAFEKNKKRFSRLSFAAVCLGGLTLVYGGFVAGHKAGLIYNTFPLMDGSFFPEGGWQTDLGVLNLYQNPVVVQFIHRVLALATFCVGGFLGIRLLNDTPGKSLNNPAFVVLGALVLQVTLGIVTLLLHVPLEYALLHQLMGIILFMILLRVFYKSTL